MLFLKSKAQEYVSGTQGSVLVADCWQLCFDIRVIILWISR